MKTRWLCAALILSTACGGSSAETDSTSEEESVSGNEDEHTDQPAEAFMLNGHYRGQPPPQPEGAIGMSMEYRFDAVASSYEMTGYPSIMERGSFLVIEEDGATRMRFTSVRRCGPCENDGPNEDGPDAEHEITLADDGSSFTLRDWTFTRTAE